jgi:hypothetical protein
MEATPKTDDQAVLSARHSSGGNGAAEPPSLEESRAALEAVLQSAAFLRAEQKRSFLRYICEMELSGRGAELSEYVIGVEALGRPPGYSTGEDSSVRRHAHDLRQRLEEVYSTELASARVRIDLPKGGYAPRFVYWDRAPAAAPVEARPAPAPAPGPPPVAVAPRRPWKPFGLGVAAGVALASAAVGLWAWRDRAREATPPAVEAGARSVEAESHAATITGRAARGDCRGCSQGGRVRWIGKGNELTLNRITVGEAGNYTLQIDYILEGERGLWLSVNGGDPMGLSLKGNSWNVPSTTHVNVALRAGPNSVRFFNDRAYGPDLDRIVVR